jgi:hypothetical protein
MGQHMAKLILLALPATASLGACSLIYSPSNLPDLVDAPTDAPPEVVRENLKLERVSPTVLLEGQGANGGRPAILVIHGSDIAPDATVSLKAHEGEVNSPSYTIDNVKAVVSGDHTIIAVPITLNVDANIGEAPPATGRMIRLDVTVTQPGAPAPVTLSEVEGGPALTLQGLDELSGTPVLATDIEHVYSRVSVTSVSAAPSSMAPLIIRSTSSIEITGTGTLSLNAVGDTAGPGGFAGGRGGEGALGAAGKAGQGPGAGQPNGGGAGFSTAGGMGAGGSAGGLPVGDAALTTLAIPNRGSGGAGGAGGILSIEGGRGGGGGGSIELTAAGDLTVAGTIEAKGSGGTTANGTTGGGGSGGVILLRAGGTLDVQSVDVSGGPGGNNAGAGAAGRIRVDSPSGTLPTMSTPAVGYRGPMLVTSTPMTVNKPTPNVRVAGQASSTFKYTIEDGMGRTLGPFENTIGATGELSFDLAMPLSRGFNRICTLVTGVTIRREEAENCITLAYVP